MPLLACRDCGRDVSDAAPACDWIEKTRMVNEAAPDFRMPVFWLSQLYFMADVIVFFVSSRRRALHDLIAGTVVIHD